MAVSVPICRLSGLRATAQCAQLSEWFVPGTAPSRTDDWESDGRVTLPVEYADWSRQGSRPVASDLSLHARAPMHLLAHPHDAPARADVGSSELRVVSPMDGDRYAIPAGVEARYATISLRAGGRGANGVRWTIDGRRYEGARWPLARGTHVIQATSPSGENAEAHIVVDR